MRVLKDNPPLHYGNWIIIFVILLLILITFLTKYYGSTDIGDYSDIAKYFSGSYIARIRSSHSLLYGTLHSPLIFLFKSLIAFKISSLIFLLSLIYSAYLVSGKNKDILWLMLLSPVVWYMAPWLSPLQLVSLLFFLGYYSIKKYKRTKKIKFLFFSGILIGLSWAFWDITIIFAAILAFSFLYNEKFYHFFLFLVFILIGLLPKLLFDQFFLGFAFIGLLRYFFGIVAATFFGGIYGTMKPAKLFFGIFFLLFFIPFFTYKIFSRKMWKENKRAILFITASLLLILFNTQIRYLLLLTPIIIFELAPTLTHSQIKKQIIFSIIVILIVVFPYLIQTKYSTNTEEFSSLLTNFDNIELYEDQKEILKEDFKNIERDFPNKVFVVGNKADDYQLLAHFYWGGRIKKFISIQDYQLYFQNKTVLFEKKFMPVPKIEDRRQIWISGGIGKNENDNTDYEGINYAIGVNEPVNIEGFSFVKKYHLLYISKKSN